LSNNEDTINATKVYFKQDKVFEKTHQQAIAKSSRE